MILDTITIIIASNFFYDYTTYKNSIFDILWFDIKMNYRKDEQMFNALDVVNIIIITNGARHHSGQPYEIYFDFASFLSRISTLDLVHLIMTLCIFHIVNFYPSCLDLGDHQVPS